MLPILKNGGAPLLIPSIGRSPQSLVFAYPISPGLMWMGSRYRQTVGF